LLYRFFVRILLFLLLVTVLPGLSSLAEAQEPASTIFLWTHGAPDSVGASPEDQPRLEVFLPDPSKQKQRGPLTTPRTAVLILPGGAYHGLALQKEGEDPARWFNHLGIPAFVLIYRLGPRYHYPAPFDDATRAMRYVRVHAADYGISPNRIGIMGFSAGGHLASTVGTHFLAGKPDAADPLDRASSRPDFLVLGYPVIDPLGPAAVASYHWLLGDAPDPQLVALLSNDTQVTAETPPTFLVAASDDDAVSPLNSVNFYTALVKAGVPVEMHLYDHGGHGFGMAALDPVLSPWMDTLLLWLEHRGLLSAPPSQQHD
jgi:acetyl esterase/lipase